MPRPELSLVIPIYNEEEVLPHLEARLAGLLTTLALDCEVVFVDDGSKDESLRLLREMAGREPRYRVASFSRNFGHQRAITCGMDLARGKAVVVMDADLQDPPEVIQEMVAKWREGYDVVYGRRRSRAGETTFKLLTAKIFYRLFAAMIPIEVPLDAGDFRLMSRRVVQTLRGLRETHRFVRGLVAWVGFKQIAVEYDREARAAGETKYPLRKMLAFAFDGIASFSIVPLRAASYVGVLVGLFGVLVMIFAVVSWMMGKTIQGWTTIIILLSFLFSVQLVIIGVLGEYVGKIYEQVKRRPLYVVAERINFGRRRAAVGAGAPAGAPAAAPAIATASTVIGMPSPLKAPDPTKKAEELDSAALMTDYGTTPAVMAELPRPATKKPPPAPAPAPPPAPAPAPSAEELDSSALKTDYGTTPAVIAELPRSPLKKPSAAPPPRPSTKPPPPKPKGE